MKLIKTGVVLTASIIALTACSDSSETDGEQTSPEAEVTTDEKREVSTDDPVGDQTGDQDDSPTTNGEDPADPSEQVATPEAIDSVDDMIVQEDGPATVTWVEPGKTLHIYVAGSSTPGCYPTPTEARTDGTSIEITFEPSDLERACTQDLMTHGWEVTWDSPFEVTEPMPITLKNASALGQDDEGELPVEQTAGEATK